MKTRIFLLLLVIPLFISVTPPVQASGSSIAAIVNDEVITKRDVENRIKLTFIGREIPKDKNFRKNLETKILDALIDEALQNQAAKQLNSLANEQEVESALKRVAAANNISVDKLESILKQSNVSKNILVNKLTSEVNWAKVTSKKFYGKISVSDTEVNQAATAISNNAGETEYHIAEILLSVDKNNSDKKAKALAQKIMSQLKQGIPFQALANKYSQSITAARGGDLGWVLPDQVEPSVYSAIEKIKKGELVRNPIRTKDGYMIVYLIDKRVLETKQTKNTMQLKNSLVQRKLNLKARQYLKELRESAHIEKKL